MKIAELKIKTIQKSQKEKNFWKQQKLEKKKLKN